MHAYTKRGSKNLLEHLEHMYGPQDPDPIPDYICEGKGCGQKNTTHTCQRISRFPDYLAINLARFTPTGEERGGVPVVAKSKTTVSFSETMDLSKCFVPINDTDQRKHTIRPPFRYEVYAVLRHSGKDIISGHYRALTRHLDQPLQVDGEPAAGSWHIYNDRNVIPLTRDPNKDIFFDATMVFLKRVGTLNQ
jgi:ubiquitin C-terminal hydrolase